MLTAAPDFCPAGVNICLCSFCQSPKSTAISRENEKNIFFLRVFLLTRFVISAIIHICVGLPARIFHGGVWMPERLTSNRKVIGTKQLRKTLKAGRVRTAYVAADADPILREPLVEQCRAEGVELVEIATMKELGRLCGIHVGAACAALLR